MKLPKYFIGTVEGIYGSKNLILEVSNFENENEITVYLDKKYRGFYDKFNDLYILEYIKNDKIWMKMNNNKKIGLEIILIINEY